MAGNSSRWKLPFIRETLIKDPSRPPVLALAVTETWFVPTLSEAQVELENYHCFRSDRAGRKGGGCALYLHKKCIPSNQVAVEDSQHNMVAVYIESLHTLISVVYRPPSSDDESFIDLMDKLQRMIDFHGEGTAAPDLYILGDFNLPLFDWTCGTMPNSPPNKAYQRVMDLVEKNFLIQMAEEPTRLNHTLDLIFTNRTHYVMEVNTEETQLSDHRMVECLLGFNPSSYLSQHHEEDPFSFRAINLFKADTNAMNSELSDINWNQLQDLCNCCGDTDGSMFKELIVLTVLQVSIKHCPSKNRPLGAPKSRAERAFISLKFKKKKLNKKIKDLQARNPSSTKIKDLQTKVCHVVYEMKEEICDQLNQKEQLAVSTIKSNPKYFYSYAKRLSKCKSTVAPLKDGNGILTNNPREKASILQDQYKSVFSDPEKADIEAALAGVPEFSGNQLSTFVFEVADITAAIKEMDPYSASPDGDIPAKILCDCKESLSLPIWLLWTASFKSGIVPEQLKRQYITPLFKKGNKTEAANYRPVSLTSHLMKVFERVVRKHLVNYFEHNELFPDNQHGFRKNRSCLTQLIEHFDSVLKSLNEGNEVDVIYLDFSKAFDKVDHNILLAKLKRYGVTGQLYAWIESFLRGRKQAVVVDGHKSEFVDVDSSVPQGTVLGPVFFIIYAMDMIYRARNSKALTFADDTKLIKAITTLFCKILLEDDLTSIIQWSIANNMLLHEDKFVVVNYCLNTSLLLRNLPFTAETRQYLTSEGNIMECSSHTRDLGVHVSNDCSWSYHISKIAGEARQMAGWVLGAYRDRSMETMMTLYKSLIRSKLEYCCPLWNPSKIKDIQTVENIQREFTRRISGLQEHDYWERLKKLKLLSLQRRRERYSIIQVWKIKKGLAPNSVGMEFYDSPRLGTRAKIPKFNYKAQTTISTSYDDSFGVKGARLWNILPKHVNTQASLESFKVSLGEFLLKFPDRPPVMGYTPPNSNSLLDWNAVGGVGVCA